jgi:hypothetical protein
VKHIFDLLPDGLKHALDAVSIIALLGSLISVLPAVASLLTIVWTVIRIYETETVQRALGRRKERP